MKKQGEKVVKKLLSVVLSAVMILSLVPLSMFAVSAEETLTDSQGVEYTISEDGTYYIVSDCGKNATEVVIPAEFNGLPVKEIGDSAFYDCDSLTSVVIGDSVTSIGGWVFYNCTSLTSIEIPNSVTTIGEAAFFYCTSLTSVVIGDSVTSISVSVFYGCDNLQYIEHSGGKYLGNSNNPYLALIDVTSKNITSLTIHDDTKIIGDDAFYACTSLTSIDMGNSVTSIGNWAFAYCECLTSIEIPNSVTSIGRETFAYCKSLTSIVIPDSVTSIGDWAFEYCDSLTDIYCEAESQPEGWNEDWNYNCSATVHWGCEMTNTSKPTLGDIDGDDDVDASDYILIKRAVLNTYALSEQQKLVADVDADSDVDATDYVLVKRIVLGTYKVD